jgi:hypothetical protein
VSTTQRIGAIAAAVTAVAGAIAAVVALVPGGETPPPQPKPVAALRVIRFEPSVTHGEFAKRYPALAPDTLAIKERNRPGGVWHLELQFSDFDAQRCTLRWTMIDDANDSPVPGEEFIDHEAADFVLERSFEHFTPAVWVPAPNGPERVYFVMSLTSEEGRPCGGEFHTESVGTAP